MDHPAFPPEDLRRQYSRPATHLARRPPQLRIVVPPTEYCPFSTDLTLPITPLSLPTPVSSSCFTFSDMREIVTHTLSVPPTPAPLLSSCSQDIAVADFASPTSSQFLLMPSTPHLENTGTEAAISVSPPSTPAANELIHSGPTAGNRPKPRDLHPWEVSSSTWLSDLGGHTETDRIFRHNLLEITSVESDSSPASTPALSPSAVSPSHISFVLASNLHAPLAIPSSPALSASCAMSPSTSPARLLLKPTGTDTFPSTLDGLQAWRESVTLGIFESEEPRLPLSDYEDVHGCLPAELEPEITLHPSLPSRQLHSRCLSPPVQRSRTFIERARMFGGRVKQLVKRQSTNKYRRGIDRPVSFRQDSEDGSVILITAPPPPYDVCQTTHTPHGFTGQEYARSRSTSEYSAVQATMVEHVVGATNLGPRQGNANGSTLRRLSLAALSSIKRS